MSVTQGKVQLKAALASVSWSIPTSAQNIAQPVLATSFGRIDTQQFAGEEAAVTSDHFPYVRIWMPDGDEQRKTSGGDLASEKWQLTAAHLWIYQSGFVKDWQGLGDYFDAVVDATLAYFRNHSSPQPGSPAQVGNDAVSAWGLRQRWRIELPEQQGAQLDFRATLAVDVRMTIV